MFGSDRGRTSSRRLNSTVFCEETLIREGESLRLAWREIRCYQVITWKQTDQLVTKVCLTG